MPLRTESIKAFLQAKTLPDLAALYTHDMEVQVLVAADGGERVEKEFFGKKAQGWTDGAQIWKSFRIPYNASTIPEYTDIKMSYDLSAHAEGIGLTGWDWVKNLSRWIAYDFDAITGHKDKHAKKLTQEQLDAVQESVSKIPWVTIRRSTGGKGLHVYVFLEPVLTKNHSEHAALARAILGKMSALSGHDLETDVDVCGQNMWIWHRKMAGTNGLELIKKGEIFKAADVPINWRDHIPVITGHRKRNIPKFISESSQGKDAEHWFLELAGQYTKTPLDEEHKKLIKWLEQQGTACIWNEDFHMLITHTYYLKKAQEELQLRGFFETISAGTEAPVDLNAFMFPIKRGAWAIRRYSMGVAEAPSWQQDGKGWTRCFYNVDPDLASAARSLGGLEDTNGSFEFQEAEIARDAARILGASIPELPTGLKTLKARIKEHKDGRLLMEIEGDQNKVAASEMQGWLHKRGKWTRLFNVQQTPPAETEVTLNDELIRHIVTETGEDQGWLIKRESGVWSSEPLVHITKVLEASGMSSPEIKILLGSSIMKCWTLVNRPFQPEYTGDRTWNREAAQLKYVPSLRDELYYPSWMKILSHIGSGLDYAVEANPWCKMNGILTGADYIKCWIASVFKFPMEPLPYLFIYGSQNCGKSILHEALNLLLTKGYARADNALISQGGFNAELQFAILCVIEELDLKKNKIAANRIKDFVTAREMPIHTKGMTPFLVKNTTHWMQFDNESTSCPIFPGDSRITVIHVPDLDPLDAIPKKKLIPMLEIEASDFLAAIMKLELPESPDRLNIPVIMTAEKLEAENSNRTPVEIFLAEHCFRINGEMVLFGELFDRFLEFSDPNDVVHYTKQKFGRELPAHFPKGRSRKDGRHYVGNISLVRVESPTTKSILRASPPDANNYIFLDSSSNGVSSSNGTPNANH